MKKLSKAILLVLGSATATVGSLNASADVLLTGTGNLAPQGWSGHNNGNFGWVHHSDWFAFQANSVGSIDIKVTAQASTSDQHPAFTVWNSGSSAFAPAAVNPDAGFHSYNQVASDIPGTFVGFSNNYGPNDLLGFGPGANALAGTQALHGTDGTGHNYAELIFNNLTTGAWYSVVVGGSSSAVGAYNFTANISSVPVPGAVWLFGSAMAGLIGFGKRKRAA